MSKEVENNQDGLAALLAEEDPNFVVERDSYDAKKESNKEEVIQNDDKLPQEEDNNEKEEEVGSDSAPLSDVELEAQALESEEFSISNNEKDKGSDDSEFDNFAAEDYVNKEKIPLIREDNRRLGRAVKDYEQKEVEWVQATEEKENRIKELESKLEEVAIPTADFTKDPEFIKLAEEQQGKVDSLTHALSKVRAKALSSQDWDDAYKGYAEREGDLATQNEYVFEKSLEIMGKGSLIDENIGENGEIDIDAIYESLSPRERQMIPSIESSLETALRGMSEANPKVSEIKKRVSENSEKYHIDQKINSYNEDTNSFRESMKGLGVLDEQSLELEDNTYSRFIHDKASDPNNKKSFDEAVDILSQYKYGMKPISEQVFERYENQANPKTRKEVEKMAMAKHQKRITHLDKEIASFLANRSEIYEIVEKHLKNKAKEENRRKEKKKVSSAQNIPTKKEEFINRSDEGKDHLAELLNYSPKRR